MARSSRMLSWLLIAVQSRCLLGFAGDRNPNRLRASRFQLDGDRIVNPSGELLGWATALHLHIKLRARVCSQEMRCRQSQLWRPLGVRIEAYDSRQKRQHVVVTPFREGKCNE
jgi:hypothetical protein